jgi:hypothetical protein
MSSLPAVPPIAHFVPELLDRLYAYWAENGESIGDWNIHRAFTYWAADLLDTADPDVFTYSDGADDRGIDFFTSVDHVYALYQTKCPAEENLEELAAEGKTQSYDADTVNQIVEAVHYLRDRETEIKGNNSVQLLRHDYNASLRQAPASTSLTAALVVLGELTDSAREHFQSERERLASDGVDLRLVEWREIAARLRPFSEHETHGGSVTFTLDNEKDPLKRPYWTYFLARGGDLVQAFRDQGYGLFDWNVRAQLKRSPINRKIRDSLGTSQGRKRFHHLNNGLLVCARTVEFKSAQGKGGLPPRIVLRDPQVINGCQTVTALYDAWQGCRSETELEDFERSVRVQVKVIDLRDPAMDESFISDLIVSTNDQNPMSPRNLKSNTPTQVEIQTQFSSMAIPIYFERKDGEFDAVLSEKERRGGIKPALFRIPDTRGSARRNFRVVDNDKDVARPWHSVLGFSGKHTMGTVKPFENDAVYKQVFLEQPKPEFWLDYSNPDFAEPKDDLFGAGGPSAYQLVLAATLSKYASSQQVGSRVNRQNAVRRLIERGKINGSIDPSGHAHVAVPEETVSQALLADVEYNVMRLLDNAQPVFTELLAFLLVTRYGALDAVTCRRLLARDDIASFLAYGFAASSADGGETGLLGVAYRYARFCFEQYFQKHKNEILTAPRSGRTHFGKRDNIIEMRREIVDQIEESRSINFPWKPMDKTVIDCLPTLSEGPA